MSRAAAPLSWIVIVACALVASCGGANQAVTPPTPVGTSNMSATIDGTPWTAAGSAFYSNGALSVSGTSATTPPQAIGFALVVSRPGTYPIGAGNVTGANAVLTVGAASWQAIPTSGTGSITVDTLNTHSASGTFAFTAAPVPGTTASGTRIVAAGQFDISF